MSSSSVLFHIWKCVAPEQYNIQEIMTLNPNDDTAICGQEPKKAESAMQSGWERWYYYHTCQSEQFQPILGIFEFVYVEEDMYCFPSNWWVAVWKDAVTGFIWVSEEEYTRLPGE